MSTAPTRSRSARFAAAIPPLFVLAEVLTIFGVAKLIGWWTLPALMAVSALGLLVIAGSSRRAWRDIREMRAKGVAPGRTAGDAALTLTAGVLLLIPGFLSGLIGLLLLIPPVRALARRLVRIAGTRHVLRVFGIHVQGGAGENLFGDVVQSERTDAGAAPPHYDTVPRTAIEGTIVDDGPQTKH
ncbi:FxsA family protein [Dermacoccaceae bacterium W4C1]